jgi:hypothetical protein
MEKIFDTQSKHNSKVPLSNLAIWSIVLGILSTPPFPFSFLTGIPAIIFGQKAINKIKINNYRGKTLASIVIILGYISIFITVVLIVAMFLGILKP